MRFPSTESKCSKMLNFTFQGALMMVSNICGSELLLIKNRESFNKASLGSIIFNISVKCMSVATFLYTNINNRKPFKNYIIHT